MLIKILKLKEFLTLDNCIPIIQHNAADMCDGNAIPHHCISITQYKTI